MVEELQEKSLDKATDSKPADSAAAHKEAEAGMKDLSDGTKSYYEARKGGLRDKSTMEYFGNKPTFFDSNMAANQMGKPGDGEAEKVEPHKYVNCDRNDDDTVKSIKYPDGSKIDIKYDEHKQANEIKDKDGTWKKDKDGWNHYDEHNKKNMHLNGDVKVDNDGEITFKEKNGYTEKYSPDGTIAKSGFQDGHTETSKDGRTLIEDKNGNKNLINPDRSEVRTDAEGHVSSVKHPDGKTTSYKWENGKLSEIHNPDGSTMKNEGEYWAKYKGDQFQGVRDKSDYDVAPNGDLTRTAKDGSQTEVTHPDNSRELKYQNGAEVDYDRNGHVERTVTAAGKTVRFGYDKQGQLKDILEYDKNGELKEGYGKSADGKWYTWEGSNGHPHDSSSKYDVNPKTGEVTETYPNGQKRVQYSAPNG